MGESTQRSRKTLDHGASVRILHVLHSVPTSAKGGTETYVRSLVKAQRDSGDQPEVLAWSGVYRDDLVTLRAGDDVVPVFLLDAVSLPLEERVEGRSAEVQGTFLELLRSERPDVVHVHHWHGLTSDLVRTSTRAGVPAVVSLHDLFSTCPLFFRLPDNQTLCPPKTEIVECVRCIRDVAGLDAEFLTHAFERRVAAFRAELKEASAVLALSATEQEFLRQIPSWSDIDIDLLPLPDLEPASRSRIAGRARSDGSLRLVSWGGLVPGKGMLTVVEACERLAEPKRVSIDHYGRVLDEGFRERLESAASRVKLKIHGPYESGAEAELFGAYDVAIFPSLFLETHGFVMDEAIGLGLPVLVSDRGAPKERIGDCGAVFVGGDADSLAARIQELLDEPERMERMRNATKLAQPTIEEHRAALATIYRRAISSSGPRES